MSVSFLSAEGRAERPPEVPRVPAVVFSRAAARLCAAPRASGARCGFDLAPSPARPAPARETRTRSRGAQQDQERQKEQNRVHRTPAHGSGEEIRETEISLDSRQVGIDCFQKKSLKHVVLLQLTYFGSLYIVLCCVVLCSALTLNTHITALINPYNCVTVLQVKSVFFHD